jgi:hypothetical protein
MKLRIAAVACLALAALPASASAATTLATGVLRDSSGQPHAGSIVAYGWVYGKDRFTAPLVGRGTAGADGRYVVQATDEALLRSLAAPRHGALDITLDADVGMSTGETVTTTNVAAGQTALAQLTGTGIGAPQADITARFAKPAARHLDIPGVCFGPDYRKLGSQVRPAVIGEINNAYRDTRATFLYGSRADSSLTVWFKPAGENWGVDGSWTVSNQADHREGVDDRTGPYARQLQSNFRFVHYYKASHCTGHPSGDLVRADDWIGGIDDSRKLRGTIRVCPKNDTAITTHFAPHTMFHREESRAVEYAGGANAYGLGFSVSSGYSNYVQLTFRFGGRNGRIHYLCGSNRQPPKIAPRVFSGASPGT